MTITGLLRPDRGEERGDVKGVAIGVVTNNRDDEGLGRVKVRYPWREDQESYWARMAVPMAGSERGTWFLPEVDDEVLLAFDQDDIRHPYVIGALWNGRDAPPQTNDDGRNDIRQIRSRSGHELTFDDRDGAEKIEIRTQAGHVVRIDDTTGSQKIEVRDEGGSNKLTIDITAGSVEIESAASLKLTSAQIDIEASGSMKLKSGGTLTIQGTLVRIN